MHTWVCTYVSNARTHVHNRKSCDTLFFCFLTKVEISVVDCTSNVGRAMTEDSRCVLCFTHSTISFTPFSINVHRCASCNSLPQSHGTVRIVANRCSILCAVLRHDRVVDEIFILFSTMLQFHQRSLATISEKSADRSSSPLFFSLLHPRKVTIL